MFCSYSDGPGLELISHSLVPATLHREAAESLQLVTASCQDTSSLYDSLNFLHLYKFDKFRDPSTDKEELKMYEQKKISVVQTLASAPWNLDVRGIQHPKPDKYFFYQDKLPTMKYSTEPNTIWDQGLFTTELFSEDISRVIIQKADLSDAGGEKKCTEQAPIPTLGSNERVVHFEFGSQPYTKPDPPNSVVG